MLLTSKRAVAPLFISATALTLLTACGTSAECVPVSDRVVDAIKSGQTDRSVTFGSAGSVEASSISARSGSSLPDRDALLVAIEIDGWPNGKPGVWKVGVNRGSPDLIFAVNSYADEVAEWPLIRSDHDLLSDAKSCA